MDEALAVLRPLLAGAEITLDGGFFRLDRVRVLPAPRPPVPVVIGDRSDAALHRVARYGDGWLGLWFSPARYASAALAGQPGRSRRAYGRMSRRAAGHSTRSRWRTASRRQSGARPRCALLGVS
jgi:alkanesulfonate monooxygenase SsuD/methylene tetrahydromethanopterin reductase-like flavin-dependent oxidoreductase (luciferase family)